MSPRRVFGKFLELAGMGLVGLALFVGLGSGDMARELSLLAAGTVVFLVGRVVAGGSRPSA